MFPYCLIVVWVYRSGLLLERCVVSQVYMMFNFRCVPKVQVVLGKDIRISLQTLSDLVFPLLWEGRIAEVECET